jgi:hypothetical protein
MTIGDNHNEFRESNDQNSQEFEEMVKEQETNLDSCPEQERYARAMEIEYNAIRSDTSVKGLQPMTLEEFNSFVAETDSKILNTVQASGKNWVHLLRAALKVVEVWNLFGAVDLDGSDEEIAQRVQLAANDCDTAITQMAQAIIQVQTAEGFYIEVDEPTEFYKRKSNE